MSSNKISKQSVKIKRPIRNIKMEIEEMPEKPIYSFRNDKDKVRFIKHVEAIVRRTDEYREYIQFIKKYMDMDRCIILKGISKSGNKRYSIELHHEPFTLFDIVAVVLEKYETLGMTIDPFDIADEVMLLHFDEKVGLVPLSKTMHQLVHDDKIFIPLQYIYHSYDKFYNEYQEYIEKLEKLKDKIEMKVNLSLKCEGNILTDILDPEFVYIEVDGFNFPQIPDEWGKVLHPPE